MLVDGFDHHTMWGDLKDLIILYKRLMVVNNSGASVNICLRFSHVDLPWIEKAQQERFPILERNSQRIGSYCRGSYTIKPKQKVMKFF